MYLTSNTFAIRVFDDMEEGRTECSTDVYFSIRAKLSDTEGGSKTYLVYIPIPFCHKGFGGGNVGGLEVVLEDVTGIEGIQEARIRWDRGISLANTKCESEGKSTFGT